MNRCVRFDEGSAVCDENEGFHVLRVKSKLAHEASARRGLQWREPKELIFLVAHDEPHGFRAKIAYTVKDNQVVHCTVQFSEKGLI